MKNCNQESGEGYFVEVDVWYPEQLHNLHTDLHFPPVRINDKFYDYHANCHANLHHI